MAKKAYSLKDRLKQIRLTLGYNQQEMAEKLSIEVRKLRSYEYETKNFPLDFLISLINVFDVNINWLLTGKGEMFQNFKVKEKDEFTLRVEDILRQNGLIK